MMLNKTLVGCVSLMALMAPVSAMAQTAPDTAPQAADDQNALGDIIVQARRVNENLQDVPVAVTAFSGDDLINQGVRRTEDLANFTPGLAIRQGQSTPSAITISLRGQVQTDILATLDPSVGTYVDNVYWARAYGLNADLLDIQSVQVLKGPQGTLFGRNTTGGALLINSNNPDMNDYHGRVSLTYGRFNEFNANGFINIPIIEDRISLRIAGQRVSRDGYVNNLSPIATTLAGNTVVARGPFSGLPAGTQLNGRDRYQFRAKLEIRPTDTLSLRFSAEYFDMDELTPDRQLRLTLPSYTASNTTYSTSGTAGTFVGILNGNSPATAQAPGVALLNAQAALNAANPNSVFNDALSYTFARTHTYGFEGALDTGWGEIKLIASTRDVNTGAGLDLEGSGFAVHFTEAQQRLKQQSAELQITGAAFNDAVDFAVGGFVFHESGIDQSISITVPALNPATSHFTGLIDNDSIGMYAQATWHITDALSFTGGLRYSVDDKALETRNNNYIRTTGLTVCSIVPGSFALGGEVTGPVQCALRRRDSFAGWSYAAGFEYRITDDVLAYVRTSKGFRSGGQNLRAPNAAAFIPFQPEEAYSYEIGLKSEFFDRRLRVNLAAYTTDVNNIQRSSLIATPPIPPSTVPGTATILSNAGKARFRGFEAEVTLLVTQGLTLSASGALVDPEYVSFRDLSGDRSFERFTGVAESQFALAADYSTAIGSSNRLALHVDYSWRGDVPTAEYNFVANPNNQAIIDATTAPALGQLGARATFSFGEHFEFAVFGRNITDDRSYVQNLLVAPLGYITGIRNEPATYGATATFRF